jgi:hypothetical protein
MVGTTRFCQGAVLHVAVEYSGGRKGACKFRWFRVRSFPDGSSSSEVLSLSPSLCLFRLTRLQEVPGQNGPEYTLGASDVGCTILVEFTPVRDDGAVGTPVSARTARTVYAVRPTALNVTLAGRYGCPPLFSRVDPAHRPPPQLDRGLGAGGCL